MNQIINHLYHIERRVQQAPHDQLPFNIMPNRNKQKNWPNVPDASAASSERHVHVPDEQTTSSTPNIHARIIITMDIRRHAADLTIQ